MSEHAILKFEFNNIKLGNFDLCKLLKYRRYTLTALDNLYRFNQEYLMAIHSLEENNEEFDYEPYHSRILLFSNNVTEKLSIHSIDELNQFLSLIKVSDRLLKKGIASNDLECVETSFSTLEYNMKLLNIL
ncbi:MAG: hypothetical protein BZ136_04095 [Methanosphaera sp. rholeuAM74]|nr:MAG: hypothetical protein BZ136_04095 [Methanosphaera sp. rholeuAM74]